MKTKVTLSINASKADNAFTYQPGKKPEDDAFFKAFFIENHLDHYGYPEMVASPEQVRFMVYLAEDEAYYPCSQHMLNTIMSRKGSTALSAEYSRVLQKTLALSAEKIEDQKEKKFLEALIGFKFKHEISDKIMIPSRLEKRLLRIFLTHTQIEDPFHAEKSRRNRRISEVLRSDALIGAINRVDDSDFVHPSATLSEIRKNIEYLEFKRLVTLSVEKDLWETDVAIDFKEKDYQRLFKRRIMGNGVEPLFHFMGIWGENGPDKTEKKQKILWLADEAGEIVVDIAIIRYLSKLGHKIIIALKDGPLYTSVNINDSMEDDILKHELENAFFITEKNLSKNELVKILRSEYDIFILSDGTRENLNLLLASTTFARIFKEVDAIVSRGHDQKRRFFDTRFQFTQNIFNISMDSSGAVSVLYKPRHPAVIKFSYKDLETKADTIIKKMQSAKKKGMTVIFYSAIIGSIPGKISMAKKIISVFISSLKKKLAMTYIINPSEYYEPGMDADDLMYMWEIVQRSGFINTWRFQTYDDIAAAFQIMGTKVPPEWVGKDATYSTGCTKEMKIALEVQQRHPEMQIIGPSHEKFMRRNEYAIGKMYDKRL